MFHNYRHAHSQSQFPYHFFYSIQREFEWIVSISLLLYILIGGLFNADAVAFKRTRTWVRIFEIILNFKRQNNLDIVIWGDINCSVFVQLNQIPNNKLLPLSVLRKSLHFYFIILYSNKGTCISLDTLSLFFSICIILHVFFLL